MKSPYFPKTHRSRHKRRPQKGAALIMTLVILVILSILITGFVVSMRTEMAAAYASENIQRTKMIAQGGVSHAIDILRANIPEPARLDETAGPLNMEIEYPEDPPFGFNSSPSNVSPAQNWIVNPGRLTIVDESGQARFIDLHTGAVTGNPESDPVIDGESVDLNEPFPGETLPAIVMGVDNDGNPDPGAEAPKMRVQWVNVYEDPSKPAGPENPMVGRYAFWMDDECAKINFNTAIGKPAPGDSGPDVGEFYNQLHGTGDRLPVLTPVYRRGNNRIMDDTSATTTRTDNTVWALGHPGSVNLDVLLDEYSIQSEDGNFNVRRDMLLDDKLLVNMWTRGFSRYPEAIIDYIDVDGDWEDDDKEREWFRQNRFNLTHYSRAPEFNPFGFSRFFTTNVPISLESGPLYQLPFTFGTGNDHIFHLHSLMGTFGFTDRLEVDSDTTILAGNVVNRAQIDLIMRYLSREWPGYDRSFMQKYGYKGCLQLAIGIIRMARVATTTMSEFDVDAFDRAWSYRNTSTNYSPPSGVDAGQHPERMYWRFRPGGEDGMLPQMGGPHIMEVHLEFIPQYVDTKEGFDRYRIKFRYGVEYYMHPYGPIIGKVFTGPGLRFAFPTQVDYLDLKVNVDGNEEHTQPFQNPRWDQIQGTNANEANRMGLLRAEIDPDVQLLGPAGASLDQGNLALGTVVPSNGITNRVMAWSPAFNIGTQPNYPDTNGKNPAKIFRVKENSTATATIEFTFRLGMSVQQSRQRPKQMIPRTTSPNRADNLFGTAQLTLSKFGSETDKFVWETSDPRISNRVEDWSLDPGKSGSPASGQRTDSGSFNPDDGLNTRTGEPPEDSDEKSKFLTLQRALQGSLVYGHKLHRGDEYATDSRVISPGYWSLLHTGMVEPYFPPNASDGGPTPWRTVDLGPDQNDPPDYLLLDLFGATFPMQRDQWRKNNTGPDEFSTISFMNSTMGKINLNTRIYPNNSNFNVPDRRKPVEAVFKYLRSDTNIDQLVDGIINYQSNTEWFDYIGELAEVDGYENVGPGRNTQFEREAPLRNMAGCITTNSNTFGVWGVAQTVKKSARNEKFNAIEVGDQILGEKRFFAIIERYVWPGKDGVPGNAHVSSSGVWDKIADDNLTGNINQNAKTNTLYHLPGSPPLRGNTNLSEITLNIDKNGTYPVLDGPEPVGMDQWPKRALGDVTYEASSLEDAYNPPQAVIKYRVNYFKFLDN